MKKLIERMLHIPCEESEFSAIEPLPLFLKGAYRLKELRISGTSFLTAAPIEKINLATMRKHRKILMEIAGMECAFRLETISTYAKKKIDRKSVV